MNTSKKTIGTIRIAFVMILACVAFLPGAFAAQSTSYSIDTESPTHAEHATGSSPSYQLDGGITWRQTTPAVSNSFQIVPDLVAQVATSSTTTQTSSAGNTQPGETQGGHRGSSVSSAASLHPAASSKSSVPVRHSRASSVISRASQASSVSSEISVVTSESSASSASSAYSIITVITPEHPAATCPVLSERACQILLSTTQGGNGLYTLPDLITVFSFSIALGLMIGAFITHLIRMRLLPAPTRRKKNDKTKYAYMHVALLMALGFALIGFAVRYQAHAAGTSPERYIYNGHLLDSAGHAITTAHSIRFSLWKSADMVTGDVAAGVINTGATTYGGWQEVDTVTPDANGYFSVQLGSNTPLVSLASFTPDEIQSLFLQVEVKGQADADTSYEALDVDPANTAVDRSPIASVPFAQNADSLQQHQVGTASGSIAQLGPNGKLATGAMGNAVNGSGFTIDNNNSATGDITLQFGQTLAKKLTYDTINNRFNFNDSVNIQGNLTVLGLVNGVDVTNLGSSTGALRVFSGGGLTIKIAGGSYRLGGANVNFAGATHAVTANTTNYVFFGSGGLTVRQMAFPTDESFIPLAEAVTNAGAVNYILDRRQLMSDDREQTTDITLHPQYPDASYAADGTSNVGQLSVINDSVTLKNAYMWTSSRVTQQDYDVVVRVTLPTQFTHWKTNPLSFLYKSSSADSSVTKMDIALYDTAGNPVTLTGTATNLANTAWTTQTLDFSGSPAWTPGGTIVFKIKLSATNNEQMFLGDFTMHYLKLVGNQ